jgi:heme/copper-type cytochrome/quinol oxidase subunit 2
MLKGRRRFMLALGVIAVVVLSSAYYASTIQEQSAAPETVRVQMTTFDWGFNVTTIPNFQDGKIYAHNPTIIVHVGQRVQIELRTLDITHGFAIDAFNVQAYIPPGQLVTVTFTPTQTGNFTYYCNTFCGLGHPYMHGILEVLA